MSDDLQNLWQNQPPAPFHMALEEVRARAFKFRRTLVLRNIREYLAAIFIVAVFGAQVVKSSDTVTRIGSALSVIGAIYVAIYLYRWGTPHEMVGSGLEFYRQELERQRDLLNSVWRWYLAPLIPGPMIFVLRAVFKSRTAGRAWFWAGYMVLFLLLFYGVGVLNRWGARRLQRRIDELDELRS